MQPPGDLLCTRSHRTAGSCPGWGSACPPHPVCCPAPGSAHPAGRAGQKRFCSWGFVRGWRAARAQMGRAEEGRSASRSSWGGDRISSWEIRSPDRPGRVDQICEEIRNPAKPRRPATPRRCLGGSGQLTGVRPDGTSIVPVLPASAEHCHASAHRGCIPPRSHRVPSAAAGAPPLPNPRDAKRSAGDSAAALPRAAIGVSGCLRQRGTPGITPCFSGEFPRAAKMPPSLQRPRLHHCKTLPPTRTRRPPKAAYG